MPGGENWQLKIHTREPFATNGEGQVRLMFVFMHVPTIDGGAMATPVVALLSLSLILGWLYERTGRLLAPILVHGLFNAANLLFMTLTL